MELNFLLVIEKLPFPFSEANQGQKKDAERTVQYTRVCGEQMGYSPHDESLIYTKTPQPKHEIRDWCSCIGITRIGMNISELMYTNKFNIIHYYMAAP
jgi:hypothetical protein